MSRDTFLCPGTLFYVRGHFFMSGDTFLCLGTLFMSGDTFLCPGTLFYVRGHFFMSGDIFLCPGTFFCVSGHFFVSRDTFSCSGGSNFLSQKSPKPIGNGIVLCPVTFFGCAQRVFPGQRRKAPELLATGWFCVRRHFLGAPNAFSPDNAGRRLNRPTDRPSQPRASPKPAQSQPRASPEPAQSQPRASPGPAQSQPRKSMIKH